MQPTIPVFTVMLGILFKLETPTVTLFVGITLAFLGAVCMVLGGAASPVPHAAAAAGASAAEIAAAASAASPPRRGSGHQPSDACLHVYSDLYAVP